jgi:hypothetical protein
MTASPPLPASDYTTTRRWRRPEPTSLPVGQCGSWSAYTWDHDGHQQYGIVLVPEAAPWRSLAPTLDAASAGDAPVDPFDEADALVAVCWRYGSYVHLLTFGELYPRFQSDASLSRIGDMEMMRIQIEASAALADCLRLRRTDPARHYHRLRAALEMLPMPWRRPRDRWDALELQDAAARFAAIAEGTDALTLEDLADKKYAVVEGDLDRIEANALLNGAYRNASGIESLHSRAWNAATEVPGYLRLYAPEIKRTATRFAYSLAVELAARDRLSSNARAVVNAIRAPRAWTTTHNTAIIGFSGLAGGSTLDERLALLTARYPEAYANTRVEGTYDGHEERFTPAEGVVIAQEVLTDGHAPFRAAYPFASQ